MGSLDEKVSYFPSTQTKGIAHITYPSVIPQTKREIDIPIWISRVRRNYENAPLVVADETYFKIGVKRKLHIPSEIMSALTSSGIIRYSADGSVFHRSWGEVRPLDPLSIAQVISNIFERPIEEVFLSSGALRGAVHSLPPDLRVQQLCQSYIGTNWFEYTCRKQRNILKQSNIPTIREWYVIPASSLDNWLVLSPKYVAKLGRAGFLIPEHGGELKSKSMYNLLNTRSFAQLLAFFYKCSPDQIFIPTDRDKVFHSFRDKLLEGRVLPYLLEHGLAPWGSYTLPEVAAVTGRTEKDWQSRIFTSKGISYEHASYRKDRMRVALRGIDIALDVLRMPYKKQLSREDIAALFACTRYEVDTLHLPLSREGTYGGQQSVFPLYDKFRSNIRGLFLKNSETSNSEEKSSWYIHRAFLYYGVDSIYDLGKSIDKQREQVSLLRTRQSR